jgi:hypothetical protein
MGYGLFGLGFSARARVRRRGTMSSFALRDEIRVMVTPLRTYRRLLGGPPGGWGAVGARLALMALVLGGFITLSYGGEFFPTLLLGAAVAWAWIPVLQMLVAAGLIAVVRRRPVRLAQAIDLFFVNHGPWSLWMLVVTAVLMERLPHGLVTLSQVLPILVSALVPALWTCGIIFAFGRTVLGLSIWRAAGWTVLYQALIWFAAYLFVGAVTFRMWPFSLYFAWRP